ncbi:MAG: hypothetical protein K6F86_11090 [Lachnospiraceae bacterium]|nr:hypothetical protein [Lachnospiraceae bacterium]
MKRPIYGLIIKSLCVLITAWLLFTVLDRIFMPKYVEENTDGNVTAEFYRADTPLDAVFFGSSTVYNAIAPDKMWNEFGFSSYTRASASQTIWQSYYLIRDTVHYNRPKLVTLDVSFMKYGEDFYEEASNRKTIDGMKLSFDKLMCARDSMWEEESLYSYAFPILRFHSRWNELRAEDFKYALRRPTVTYDGFIMGFRNDPDIENYEVVEKEDYSFPPKAAEYLVRIMEYCEEEDIPLLLMKTPTYINNWFPEYDRQLEEMAGKYRNVEYVNFDYCADIIGLDRRADYMDGHSHLNICGAEKFSGFFGKYIKDRYGLPDHRQDDTYSSVWNERYTRYCIDGEIGKAALK